MSSPGSTSSTKQSRRHTVHSVHSSSSTSTSTTAKDPFSTTSGLVSFGHHGSHIPGTLHTSASVSSLSSSSAGGTGASLSMSPPQLQTTSASAPTSPTASKPRQTVISRFFKRVRFSFSGAGSGSASGSGNPAQPQQQQQPSVVPPPSLVDSIPAIPTSPSLGRSASVSTPPHAKSSSSPPPAQKHRRRHTQAEHNDGPQSVPSAAGSPSLTTRRSPPRPVAPASSAAAEHHHFSKDTAPATAAPSPGSSYATPSTSHLTLPQYVTAPSPLMDFDEFSPVPRAQLVGSLLADGDGESPEVQYASVGRRLGAQGQDKGEEHVDGKVPDSTSTEGINTSLASTSDTLMDHPSFHTARLPPSAPANSPLTHVRSPTAPTFLRRPSTTASITSSILPRPASAGPPSAGAADEQLIMLPTGLHRIISRLRRDEAGVVVSVLPTPGGGGGAGAGAGGAQSPLPSGMSGTAGGLSVGGVAGNRQPSIASGGSGGSGGVGMGGGGGGTASGAGVLGQGGSGAAVAQGPARLRQQFWMKDEACKECYDCKTPFSTFRRKHHCRICGQIFCYRCASNTIPGESLGYVGTIRVCDYCLNVMRSYSGTTTTNAANVNASTTSIPNLQNANYYHRSSGLSSYYFDNYSPPASPRPPSMFGGAGAGTGAGGFYGQMPPTPRGIGFPGMSSSGGRPRSLYWMEDNAAAAAPFRGVTSADDPSAGAGGGGGAAGAGGGGMGMGLIMGLLGGPAGGSGTGGAGAATGHGDPMGPAADEDEEEEEEEQYNTLTPQFLLQPAPPARHGGHGYSVGGGTSGTVSAGGSRPGTPTKEPGVDDGGSVAPGGGGAGGANGPQSQPPQSAAAALAAAAVAQARKRTFIHRRRSLPSRVAAAQRTSVVAPDFWLEPVESSGTTRPLLDPVAADHMRKLVRQLVSRAKLQSAWEGVMYDLAVDVCGKVVAHGTMSNAAAVLGDMDVRHLIKFKKIPGGRPSDTQFLSGAVAKKTLAHRKMASVIQSPRIVILGFPLEYHRVQDQLMSLDPVRAQERDHLKILCDRVLTLDPQVVLVERTVARLALDYLHEHGVAVAYNIKRSVLENIARFTGADVIQSIDKLAAQNRAGVGTCGTFAARMYAHGAAGGLPPKEVVPLMVFDACPPELGGCVVLRGEERDVLRKVKEVLRFVLFAFAALRRESVMLQTLGSSLASLSAVASAPGGGVSGGTAPLARVGSTLGPQLEELSPSPYKDQQAVKISDEKDPPVYDDDLLNKLLAPYRAILSTSPGIIFPAPYLIERYRREVVHRKSKTHDLSRLVGASPAPGSASFNSGSSASGSGSSSSNTNSNSGGSVAAAAPSPMLGMSASGIERVSRDALNYILESQQVISPLAHQSIIFLSCTITDMVKCVVPHLQFIEYYGADDVTLAGYIEHVVETAASLCHQCHLPFTRHRRVYYHGNRSVTVTVHEDPSVMSDTASIASAPVMTANWRNHLIGAVQQQVAAAQHPASTTNAGSMSGDAIPMGHAHLRAPSVSAATTASANATASGGGGAVIDLTQVLRVQTVCHICDAVTTPKPVPLEAAAHSFAKYLELAFYSESARSETCQHATFTDHRHIYLLSGYAVHIDVQPIRLLEVSFPSMRVVLDGAQALLGKEQARARVVALIESVFLSVEKSISQHLHQLSTNIAAAAGGQPVVVTATAASSGHASGVSSPIGWATGGGGPSTSAPASTSAVAAVSGSATVSAAALPPAGSTTNNNSTSAGPLSTSLAATPSSFLPSAASSTAATTATTTTAANSTNASTLITNHAIAVDETEFRDLMLAALQEKQELLDMCTEVFERTPVHDVLCFNTVIQVLLTRSATWVEHLAKLKQHMAAVTSQVTADSKAAAAAAAAANSASGPNGSGGVGANGLTIPPSQAGGANGSGVAGAGGSASESNVGSAPGGVAGFIAGSGGADAGGSSLAGGTGWILRALQEMSTEVKRTAMAKLDLPTPSTSPINKPLHVAMEAAIDAEEYLGSPATSKPTPIMMPSLDRVLDDDVAARPPSIRAGSGNEKADGKKTSGIVQSLVNLLTSGSSQASSLSPLTAILSPTEHFVQGNPVILREDEPTSIVAFAHKTPTYCRQLEALQRKDSLSETPTADIGVSPFREIQVQEPDGDVDEEQIAETWLEHDPGSSGHIDVEQTEGPLRLGCRTYFAAEFHQLRQNCQVDPYFVHSMSRCHVWDASGGKSGSTFLKTRDDRFVIKQVSKMELELFSRFAPSYFAYMNKTIFSQIPTILAKIFGVYRVATKNTVTGKSMKLDFMVMENLWYNKNITKMFDLKGSTRNRHISTSAQQAVARTPASIAGSLAGTLAAVPMAASSPALSIVSVLPPTNNPTSNGPSPADRIQVLLDGNFIEQTHTAPLFVREYSRKVLATSIYNDTLFLSRLNIMDYSLVVGIDETNQELVVGIIDFIRTYTWDKKLETWVKETGLLGGGEPTIVSPKQYKTRFRDAMDRYFLMVPDKFCTAKSGALGHTLLL